MNMPARGFVVAEEGVAAELEVPFPAVAAALFGFAEEGDVHRVDAALTFDDLANLLLEVVGEEQQPAVQDCLGGLFGAGSEIGDADALAIELGAAGAMPAAHRVVALGWRQRSEE